MTTNAKLAAECAEAKTCPACKSEKTHVEDGYSFFGCGSFSHGNGDYLEQNEPCKARVQLAAKDAEICEWRTAARVEAGLHDEVRKELEAAQAELAARDKKIEGLMGLMIQQSLAPRAGRPGWDIKHWGRESNGGFYESPQSARDAIELALGKEGADV